eukprot:scaffold41772_cov49-Prasinocladus_malaysianus.AAC.1
MPYQCFEVDAIVSIEADKAGAANVIGWAVGDLMQRRPVCRELPGGPWPLRREGAGFTKGPPRAWHVPVIAATQLGHCLHLGRTGLVDIDIELQTQLAIMMCDQLAQDCPRMVTYSAGERGMHVEGVISLNTVLAVVDRCQIIGSGLRVPS